MPTPTTTTTKAATTSATFICLQETSASTSSSTSSIGVISIPGPTASPLLPVTPTIQEFIDELSTTILYTELIANAGDAAKLCSVISSTSLDDINGIAINGSAVQWEVCALAAIDFTTPSLSAAVVNENQAGVPYLATALFAVQVARNHAGQPDLTLCSEIEATLINNIFVNYTNVGTAVKGYVYSAASASTSATSTAVASTTPPPYLQSTFHSLHPSREHRR